MGFTPLQLVAIRIFLTGVFLLIIGAKSLRSIRTKKEWFWIIVSGYISTLLPIYLFAVAQTKIISSTASILNALIPIMTILIGYFGFNEIVKRNQIIGVIIGLAGTWLLIGASSTINLNSGYHFSLLIILACICNAFNINLVKYKLSNINPIALATGCFISIMLPAIYFLINEGMLELNFYSTEHTKNALFYVLILVVFSTAMSRIVFNRLIQISSPAFSSTSTYIIPIVAIMLGVIDGEVITWIEYLTIAIILFSIYIVNDVRLFPSFSRKR